MKEAFICDAVRTPIGRYGGGLAAVRTDSLAAIPIRALLERNASVDPAQIDEVFLGCTNQAGEDNWNVARVAALLAGIPVEVPGATVNRLCGSGLDAVGMGARIIGTGEAELVIAGGVESMSRAPYVMLKSQGGYARDAELVDTTLAWRFPHPALVAQYGADTMPETAENVAEKFSISREDQDLFALRSQERTQAAREKGFHDAELIPVEVPQRRGDPVIVSADEHPRPGVTLEQLGKLRALFKADGTVTAGNASGINDGACALLVASEEAAKRYGLTPLARVLGTAAAGVAPRIMGIGPVYATRKLLERLGMGLNDFDVIELNEAFAAQGLAVLRELGLEDDAERVNPNGGAIALGHPLGMSGARLVTTAAYQLRETRGRYGLCTMCIGIGQGIAMVIERV